MIISRDDLCPCVSCLPLHLPTSPCASGRRKPECSHPIPTLPQSDSSTCTNQLLVNFVNFSSTLEDKGKGGESRFQSESNLQEENECTVIVILKFAACMTLTQCAVCKAVIFQRCNPLFLASRVWSPNMLLRCVLAKVGVLVCKLAEA